MFSRLLLKAKIVVYYLFVIQWFPNPHLQLIREQGTLLQITRFLVCYTKHSCLRKQQSQSKSGKKKNKSKSQQSVASSHHQNNSNSSCNSSAGMLTASELLQFSYSSWSYFSKVIQGNSKSAIYDGC